MFTGQPCVRTDHDCIRDTKNCTRYLQQRGFFLGASQEEQDFPIAYSIVLYKDTHLLERLLRAIYRPHNAYCLHVDKKTPPATVQAVKNIASCLQNVFLASDRLDVQWGTFSVLEAELVCMKDLWRDKRWRYFINLTGQEFPLKTNLQLVRILQAFNGSNNVDCTTNTRYSYRWYNNFGAPHNITPLKGNVHAVLSRGFVDFVLHEPVARDLLDWVKFTDFPDETFFSTLNHNPHLGVPGSYVGPPDTDASSKPYLARFKNWGDNWYDGQGRTNFNWPCFGKRVRNICIFGVGDLPMLTSRKELFANKFHSDFEPVALECLEEWLFNMTLEEYAGTVDFDVSFYENLDIVKHRVLPRLHDSRHLREKHGEELAIPVVYEDQERNDFNSLFSWLSDETSYMSKYRNVYPMATNIEFFKQCVPDGTCDVIYSSNATHLLKNPEITAPFEEVTSPVRDAGLSLVYHDQQYIPDLFKAAFDTKSKQGVVEDTAAFADSMVTIGRVTFAGLIHDNLSDMRSDEEKTAIVEKYFDTVKYELPDQVWVVSDESSGSLTHGAEVMKTSSEARKVFSVDAGVDVQTKKFGFSASISYSKAQSTLLKNERKVEFVSHAVSSWRVDLQHKDMLSLGESAQRVMNGLPAQYTANPKAYEEFVRQFGTHYVASGKSGGVMMMMLETRNDYFEYYGGVVRELESKGLSAWQPTIMTRPWLFPISLRRISSLVRDATKRASLDQAISDHVMRVYLTVELRRVLQTLPSEMRWRGEVTSLNNKINSMSALYPLNEGHVESLGNEVMRTYTKLFLEYDNARTPLTRANKIMGPVNFECPAGKSITEVQSWHSDWHDDRTWAFRCSYLPNLYTLGNCYWTGDLYNLKRGDQDWTFSCRGNSVIKGWKSQHHDWWDTRLHQLKCCQVLDAPRSFQCSMTGWKNPIMGDMKVVATASQKVIRGLKGHHSDWHE
nr:hypothetical protein BaRGS_020756 [Batillaria attramentaria]